MPACRVLLISSGCRVKIAAIPPPNAYTAHTNAKTSAKEPNTSMATPLPPGDSGCDGAADAHALTLRGARQRWKFGDGVIVRLAFSVPQPRQKSHRSYNDTDSHAKLYLLLHGSTPATPPIQRTVRFYHT